MKAVGFILTPTIAGKAMASYELFTPEQLNTAMHMVPPETDRFEAEVITHRRAMSAALCTIVGIDVETDCMLLHNETWVALIDHLLHAYDEIKAKDDPS